MIPNVTMLALVQAVMQVAETDNEVVATVIHMVNTGAVRLVGNFRGCTFTLDSDLALAVA